MESGEAEFKEVSSSSPMTSEQSDIVPKPDTEIADTEVESSLPAAIEIAKARTELEEVIFSQGTPPELWPQKYADVMKQHPSLSPYRRYRRLFDEAYSETVRRNERVNNLWSFAYQRHGRSPDLSHLATGDDEITKTLLENLSGFVPKNKASSVKGPTTIRIFLEREDYEEYWRYTCKLDRTETINALAHYESTAIIPLIVMTKELGYEDMAIEGEMTMYHELEHAQHHSLKSVAQNLASSSHLEMPKDAIRGVGRFTGERYPHLHDEMLAYFTETGFINFDITRDTLVEDLSKYGVYFKKLFKDDRDYMLRGTKSELHANYDQVVNNAVDALADLCLFSRDNYPDYSPMRMTTNTLMQFPIEKWPAVVRLLKMKMKSLT